MNVKKTIAAIAAIAMAASSTNLVSLFTVTSIAADEITVLNDEIGNEGGESSGTTDAEKFDAIISAMETIIDTNDFTWVSLSDLESGGANEIVNYIKGKLKSEYDLDADLTLDACYTSPAWGGFVGFSVKVKVGEIEQYAVFDVYVTDDSNSGGDEEEDNTTLPVPTPEPEPVPEPTPDPEPDPTPVPTPVITPTPAPEPFVPASTFVGTTSVPSSPFTGTASAIIVSTPAQIAASKNSNITVNAAETDVTPAMLKAFTKNRAVKTMTLSYSSKLKIVINKSDVSGTAANLDFSLSGKNFLSSKAIRNSKALSGAEKIFQLDFTGEGDFGGVDKVTVKYRVGAKLAGKEVAVYEYKNGKLVKIGKGKVSGSGFVSFKTDHYGQFVIAVE